MIITNATLEALRRGFNKIFDDAYETAVAASFYNKVATTVPSSSGSEAYGWLNDFPDMREWVGDRVLKDMKENGYTIENKLWEATVGVQRTQIEDDKLGIYTPMFKSMGQSAGRHPDRKTAEIMEIGQASLCYDGQNFFDTDHPVYANHDGTGAVTNVSNYDDGGGAPGPAWYLLDTSRPLMPFIFQERERPEFEAMTNAKDGEQVFMKDKYVYGSRARNNVGYGLWQLAYKSKAPLTSDNLDAAIAAMMTIKRDGMNPMGITPNMLVVPPALRSAANKTVKVMLGDGGASNPNYEAVEVEVVPWLTGA